MTVLELIEKLSQYPSGAEVMVKNESGSWVDVELDYDEVTNEILLKPSHKNIGAEENLI